MAGVLAAARHGLHVLCEKPIALRLDDAARMVEAAKRADVLFGVSLEHRFLACYATDPVKRSTTVVSGPADFGDVVVRSRCDAAYYTGPRRG